MVKLAYRYYPSLNGTVMNVRIRVQIIIISDFKDTSVS